MDDKEWKYYVTITKYAFKMLIIFPWQNYHYKTTTILVFFQQHKISQAIQTTLKATTTVASILWHRCWLAVAAVAYISFRGVDKGHGYVPGSPGGLQTLVLMCQLSRVHQHPALTQIGHRTVVANEFDTATLLTTKDSDKDQNMDFFGDETVIHSDISNLKWYQWTLSKSVISSDVSICTFKFYYYHLYGIILTALRAIEISMSVSWQLYAPLADDIELN